MRELVREVGERMLKLQAENKLLKRFIFEEVPRRLAREFQGPCEYQPSVLAKILSELKEKLS